MINYTGKLDGIIQDIFNLDRTIDYDIKISKHREKRSLSANAYMWVLIQEIANVMMLSKEEVYIEMLRNYGQSQLLPFEDKEKVKEYFDYYDFVTISMLNNKKAYWFKVYKGSSKYNTKEMSILIDGVVQEAINLDIQVKTDDELDEIKKEWNNENI